MDGAEGFGDIARSFREDAAAAAAAAGGSGPVILNYRFVRDFTKGVHDQWRINALNHFHLIEQE